MQKHKENDSCPHCQVGILELAVGSEPYTTDCLICNKCDSTYQLVETFLHANQVKLLWELYEEIKHGDTEHQLWLKNKIQEFINKH